MGAKPGRVKAKWYPAIGAAVATAIVVGSSGLLLGQWVPKLPSPPNQFTSAPAPRPDLSLEGAISARSTPQVAPIEQPSAKTSPSSSANVNRQGALRISNLTEYPIRVALLAKGPAPSQPNYDIPAHWDFSPQEGSDRGLIVSLPDRGIKLKKGDILVAFAQDGSRRYWGPYVVGETNTPMWNPKVAEWQLTLQP